MKLSRYKKWGLCRTKPPFAVFGECGSILGEQIFPNQDLHQLVPVDLADQTAGIAVIGDIGGIFRQKVPDDLVNGVVAFLGKGVEHIPENAAHTLFVNVRSSERSSRENAMLFFPVGTPVPR